MIQTTLKLKREIQINIFFCEGSNLKGFLSLRPQTKDNEFTITCRLGFTVHRRLT
jgi:hypothetical protein